jgi:hypothetical protein
LNDPIESTLTLDPDDESYLVYERNIQDTIQDCVLMFCKGLHHGMITNGVNHFIVTQSDVLQFIVDHDEKGRGG